MAVHEQETRVSTGIDGLDDILYGGLVPERGYLVSGAPGTGKSIFGLHFLTTGVEAGEQVLYVNLDESTENIRRNAASLGFDVSHIEFLDLSPGATPFESESLYNVFSPGEVDGDALKDGLRDGIDGIQPDRVFIDPITAFQNLIPDAHQSRTQITSLVEYLKAQGATVVFSSESAGDLDDTALQFMSDGTIRLSRSEDERTLAVTKFRGSPSQSGSHTLAIRESGIEVSPRLQAPGDTGSTDLQVRGSGVESIDSLLHGGIETGTVTVLSGPTGVGKTTLGTQFLTEAARDGDQAILYMFEEARKTFLERARGVGLPVDEQIDAGLFQAVEIAPFTKTPDEFAGLVTTEVGATDASLVMIDGMDGYMRSTNSDTHEMVRDLHALCRYLKAHGVTVILIDTTESVTGEFMATSSQLSFLADNIVFLRYLEIDGELRKVIGVLKKRTSDFERTLREFAITGSGIRVGDPLTGFRGIVRGTPEFVTEPSAPDESESK